MEDNKMKSPGTRALEVFLFVVAVAMAGCSTHAGAGEYMALTHDLTRIGHSCSQNGKSFFLEKCEISPTTVAPGGRVCHVLQYALCGPSDTVTVQGTLTRRITFRGKQAKVDKDNHVFLAGTWTVIALIEVPPEALAGQYLLETVISYEGKTIKRSSTFRVQTKTRVCKERKTDGQTSL